MIKESIKIELPSVNLKDTKKEVGEKAYVVSLLKRAIDVCDNNLTNQIEGRMLLNNKYFGEIYEELMNISKNKKWFWRVKSKNLNIENKDKFIYDIFISNPDKKVKNYEYYTLNYIERSLIFLELETLECRSKLINKIFLVHWKAIRNSFVVLLFNIIKGVKNKEVNKILFKIREDGIIIDSAFSYGRPLTLKSKFSPKNICEQMFYYKTWGGELYSIENKLIKSTCNYTTLYDELKLSFKIDELEKINSVDSHEDKECSVNILDEEVLDKEDYVDILNKGVQLKRLGKYEEAKEMYIKAISLDNTHPNGYYNLAKVLYILGDYKASVKAYKASFERGICELQQSMKVSKARLSSTNLYIHLGHALLDEKNREGKYSDYIKEYEEGIDPYKFKTYKLNTEKIRMITNEYDKICIEAAKDYLEA